MSVVFLAVLSAATCATADRPILVVTDTDGVAARVCAPVSVDVDLATAFDGTVAVDSLPLTELTDIHPFLDLMTILTIP